MAAPFGVKMDYDIPNYEPKRFDTPLLAAVPYKPFLGRSPVSSA
jgi:hypothetical protein